MKKTQYYIQGDQLFRVTAADSERSGARVRLYYSKYCATVMPAFKGQMVGQFRDDGNGVEVTMGDKSIYFDYSQIADLRMLMNAYFKHQKKCYSKVIKLPGSK